MQFLPPFGLPQPGAPVQTGAGGYGDGRMSAQALQFRNPTDAARSMMGARTPSAEYPDGYLGTVVSRREDRMLATLKSRLTQRGYQRGVHKGERIDPQDYFWPEEFTPEDGIARGMSAERVGPVFLQQRAVPHGTVQERLTIMGQRLPRGANSLVDMDQRAINSLDRLRPAWG